MNSIILTPAELAQVPSGVIVTPGDRQWVDRYGQRYGDGLAEAWSSIVTEVFVAPSRWTALEGPCETCDGTGSVEGRNIASYDHCWADCVNGRKRIELRTHCDNCDGNIWIWPNGMDRKRCSECMEGRVLVAHCWIERIEAADNGQFAIHLADVEMAS